MTVPSEYADWSKGTDKAIIASPEPGPQMGAVVFNYNPANVAYRRSASTTSKSSTSNMEEVWKKTEPATISISDVVFEGLDTKARCDLLLGWTIPPSQLALAALVAMSPKLPFLVFQWGPPVVGFCTLVTLQECNITYTRFTDIGIPVRAKLSLTLREVSLKLPFTNPTSGGMPGRSGELVKEGDSLVRITKRAYGHPRHWREVARANGIDDPLRVKPGQHLYLPSQSDFTKEEP